MPEGLGYAPERVPSEAPRNLAMLLLGGMLCLVGVLLINHGMNLAKELGPRLVASVGLLAAGCLLVLVALIHPWPGLLATTSLFLAGILCLIGSGLAAAENPSGIAYSVTVTLSGIGLIVVGVRLTARGWRLMLGRGERGRRHPF